MSEVVKLQLIGLMVVGSGVLILLLIRAQFVRVMGFVAIVLGLFALVALSVPQMASLPPVEEKFDIATVKTPTDMATIGQKIFFSKGQCALCHTIGPSESARCPDLKGIGAKLSREFIFESLTQPQAYVWTIAMKVCPRSIRPGCRISIRILSGCPRMKFSRSSHSCSR